MEILTDLNIGIVLGICISGMIYFGIALLKALFKKKIINEYLKEMKRKF